MTGQTGVTGTIVGVLMLCRVVFLSLLSQSFKVTSGLSSNVDELFVQPSIEQDNDASRIDHDTSTTTSTTTTTASSSLSTTTIKKMTTSQHQNTSSIQDGAQDESNLSAVIGLTREGTDIPTPTEVEAPSERLSIQTITATDEPQNRTDNDIDGNNNNKNTTTVSMFSDLVDVPETTVNDQTQLHRTKIVGFINDAYIPVAKVWYDRLEKLGYDNHYIVAGDNETVAYFSNHHPSYRVELWELPPWPERANNMKKGKRMRLRVSMMFAHRWRYVAKTLQEGHHVLLTDVDNIFGRQYPMSELELSEHDAFHALETQHPGVVFGNQGFVFCGGMAWYRSNPRVIRFVQMMTDRCGIQCDDQVQLNRLIAEDIGVVWNRTESHHKERTIRLKEYEYDSRFQSLVGIVKWGFNGYARRTGHKIMVWDRDFALRGKNDPQDCPINNWVSMPLVVFEFRSQAAYSKQGSFEIWDKACPNDFSRKYGPGGQWINSTAETTQPQDRLRIR